MKKFALVLISSTIMTGSFAQTVFTYGKHAVSKDEFVRAFNKNPNVTTDRKKAIREYLDLYINFKLKVQAAYDEGLDKDPTQQYELQNFKLQIAENIINEQANVKELVREAFARSQKEIRVAQVLIEVPEGTDTADAFKRINAAYKELKDGKNFGTVAMAYSSDEAIRQTKGELGFVSAFTLPYEFENYIYGLKANGISAPIKTKLGYHIFKNLEERPSRGSRKVAQILIAVPPNATAEQRNTAAKKADSIYTLMQNKADFATLVSEVSNDLSTSSNKGELPEFTTGTYNTDFENVAFSMTKPGDLSRPFATEHGYHIIKLIEAKAAPSDISDGVIFSALQDKVAKDSRLERSKQKLIDKQLAVIKYKPGIIKEKDLFAFTDSAIQKKENVTVKGINGKSILFSFAKQNLTADDWLKFVRSTPSFDGAKKDYSQLYKSYLRASADDYYRNNLQNYNDDYAKQVKEFKEANLLFGIMEKHVWGKANSDSAGLANYYNQYKTKYTWPPSADAIIITCNDSKLAADIAEKVKTNPTTWRQVTSMNGSVVVADSGRYELSQLPVIDRTNFTNAITTAPVKNETDNSYTFNYIVNVYREPGQRSFDDARGMVISDYQQVLEDKWIAILRKKYPVKVNEPVFKTVK